MRRIKVVIEYDGTDFSGWQIQPERRTVQGEIEKILQKRFGIKIAVVAAGRTDSGVHAAGQTAHFDCPEGEDIDSIFSSVQSMMPDDISLKSMTEAGDGFHARYSALSRIYRYEIMTKPSALSGRYCWDISAELDLKKMRNAVPQLLGTHDFEPFAKLRTKKDHYRCTIFEIKLKKLQNRITIILRADRFLHGMVRALVGTLVDVGRGAKDENSFTQIFISGGRSLVNFHTPAKGLFLEEIVYESTHSDEQVKLKF